MKSYYSIIFISLFAINCSSPKYLLTDVEQYEKYKEEYGEVNEYELLNEKYDLGIPENIPLALKLEKHGHHNGPIGPRPVVCKPEDPNYFKPVKYYRDGGLPIPLPGCPLNKIYLEKRLLSEVDFYFFKGIKVKSISIYDKDLKLIANPEFNASTNDKYIITSLKNVDSFDTYLIQINIIDSIKEKYYLYVIKK